MTFFFGSILHPIATTSRFHLGSKDAFYFPILPIWPNCNNFMDPLGISPLMNYFFPLFPFSISPTCNDFNGHLWKEKNKSWYNRSDQVILWWDLDTSCNAHRTDMQSWRHEDQTIVFAFTAAMTTPAYLYLQLPVLCAPTANYATVVLDCRLDQSVPRSLFFFQFSHVESRVAISYQRI
jgi:hypothetical protein